MEEAECASVVDGDEDIGDADDEAGVEESDVGGGVLRGGGESSCKVGGEKDGGGASATVWEVEGETAAAGSMMVGGFEG